MWWLTVLMVATVVSNNLADFQDYQGTVRTLRRDAHVTRQPCVCNHRTESCTCCGSVHQSNVSARGCGVVRLDRQRNLRYEVTVNNQTVGRTEPPGTKNPMEICIPAAFLMICSKFFNVEFQNATFTFCFRFDVRYSKFTLLSVDFDCVRASFAPGVNSKTTLLGADDGYPVWYGNT